MGAQLSGYNLIYLKPRGRYQNECKKDCTCYWHSLNLNAPLLFESVDESYDMCVRIVVVFIAYLDKSNLPRIQKIGGIQPQNSPVAPPLHGCHIESCAKRGTSLYWTQECA